MQDILLNSVSASVLLVIALRTIATYRADRQWWNEIWPKFWGSAPEFRQRHGVVWIHAVSLGEVNAIIGLLDRLHRDRGDLSLVLSVRNPNALRVAKNRFPHVTTFYAPFDFSWSVKNVLRRLQPQCLIISENDLWPQMLRHAHLGSVPIAVVNSRVTRSEAKRYFRLRRFTHQALSHVRWWGAQNRRCAIRLQQSLGIDKKLIQVTGSLKNDAVQTERYENETKMLRRLLGFSSSEVILVAGSTHQPEEQWLIEAFARLQVDYPNLRLILAPRKGHQFASVTEFLRASSIGHIKRSEITAPRDTSAPITFLDTFGELPAVWGLANFAFVGGSLVPCGGQNMIEAISYGLPTCFGPYVQDFQESADALLAARACVQILAPSMLEPTLRNWLEDPQQVDRLSQNALRFVVSSSGAIDKTLDSILPLLDQHRESN